MTILTVHRPDLEDLVLDAIRLGRDWVRAASLAGLGAGNPKLGKIARVLLRLVDRNLFNPTDECILREFRIVLQAEIDREVIGTEWQVSNEDCEPGEFLLPRERPTYSARGQKLIDLRNIFDRFLSARQAALDRAAAERAIRHLPRDES